MIIICNIFITADILIKSFLQKEKLEMEDLLKYKRIKKLEMMHDDYITRAEDLYLDNKINESVIIL